MPNRSFDRTRLGEYLVDNGIVSRARLSQALERQAQEGGTLGTCLLEIGAVSEAVLLRTLGQLHESPTVDAEALKNLPPSVLHAIPEQLVRRYEVIAFQLGGNTLRIASARPGDIAIENEIVLATTRLIRTHVALDLRIQQALHRYYGYEAEPRLLELADRLDRVTDQNGVGDEPFPLRPSAGDSSGAAAIHRWLPSTPPPAPPSLPAVEPKPPSASRATALEETAGKPVDWERFDQPRRTQIRDLLASSPTSGTDSVIESRTGREIDPFSTDPGLVQDPRQPSVERARQRDRIAELLLQGSEAFRRRLVLAHRSGRVLGWKADGANIVPRHLAGLNFPVEECPPFLSVFNGSPFWLGPLPPSAGTDQVLKVLGERFPSSCLVVPIKVGQRLGAFLYVDNAQQGVTGAPVAEILQLCARAGRSLEGLIQRTRQD